jgi:intergrase/recombinase
MQLKYCRKIYASWLCQQGGLESEIVDLLQGRVPKTVFSRHYLIPADTLKDRVLEAVAKLKSKLEQP